SQSGGAESSFGIAPGFSNLLAGLLMRKEDDTFSLPESEAMMGVAFQFSPAWPLTRLDIYPPTELLLLTTVSAGFFSGNAKVLRSGVINQTRNYRYYHIPLDFELGLRTRWARAAFDLTYGVGVGFISQRGLGQTDTVTS